MRRCTSRMCGLLAAVVFCGAVPLWSAGYGHVPLSFEANRGQADAQVLYVSRGQGYGLFLSRNSATLRLVSKSKIAELHMMVLGAAADPAVEATEPLPGANHYYHGQDSHRWISGVPTFARVRYRGIYPGVDLVFYGNQRSLEYDFVVAPGANPRTLALSFDGASRIQVDRSGDLQLSVSGGLVKFLKPVAYQEIVGVRHPVTVRYRVNGGQVGFAVGSYDRTRPLIVDPTLNYSSYLGGGDLDGASAIAIDASGNAYIAGWTASANFPATAGTAQTALAGLTDAFVAKIDPLGQTLLFSTFLGGSADDTAEGIAVDPAGNVYVVGSTQSANFPTLNPLQSYGGGGDGFISKLGSSGTLAYSTYLGGSATDDAHAVAVDAAGNAYVAGMTGSSNFPVTAGAYQGALAGASDAFVVKLNAAGSAATYSTYLGGSGADEANAIAVDGAGNAWVGGFTWSPTFPATAPLQAYGGSEDGFVGKINPAGTGLLFSTFLGGSSLDEVKAIAVDGSGNAYVAGSTGSANFPVTAGAVQPAQGGFFSDEDAFVVKYNSAGTQVMYATYLGGSGDDIAYAIAVDAQGYAYVAGETASSNFPVVNSLQSYAGGTDAFVAVVNGAGSALAFSTFLGGSGDDSSRGIAVDANGRIYVSGQTSSTNFPISPVSGALQGSAGGGIEDAFLAAMQFCSYSLNATGTPFPANGGAGSLLISAAAGCPWSVAGAVPWIVPVSPVSGSGNGTVSFTVAPNTGSQTLTGALTAGWQTVQVTELAVSCTYALSVTSASPGAAGSTASFTVTPNLSTCTWAATSNAPWITVTGGASVTGAGTVAYSVAATTSVNQRSGTITAAGQTFTVTQQGGVAVFTLNPVSATPGAGAATGSAAVMCNLTDAPWTAASNSIWLSIASGSSGSGSGSVGYSATANNSVNPRSGSLTIAGLTFPVLQAGATPSFSLNPTSVNVSSGAANGTVAITGAPPDAPWTASSNTSWITVVSGSAGTGSGATGYSVAANTLPGGRTGTMTIAGQTFTIIQAGASPAATTTALGSSANPSVFGQSISLTATVSSSGATGSVTFEDGGSTLGSAALSGGMATLAISTLSPGSHSLTAVYSGDATYATSASAALAQVVGQAAAAIMGANIAYAFTWGRATPAPASPVSITSTPSGVAGLALASSGSCAWLNAALAGGSTPTTLNSSFNSSSLNALTPGSYVCNLTVGGSGAASAGMTATLTVSPPAFFANEVSVGGGAFYLQFPGNNLFGYFAYVSSSVVYHYDMGYEAAIPDASNGVYLYDYASSHWFYTTPGSFPSLYDFTLNSWIYYFPSTGNPGHYSSNPRYFLNFTTNKFFTM